ncbi:MAG TPA: FAD-linked oxidase C-terminal domain-containing protein [Bacteroidia bacterium]|nr:FAD-linked oxidase C-terminal domain-containing protein [Bacteroidia bacterium]HNT80128.1 FAD-linked oxidase C-terminal domain-containing protein [Bacteroidia bacterium]
MQYNKITPKLLKQLESLLPDHCISTQQEDIKSYGSDYTEDLYFEPEVVIKPQSVDEIISVVKFCNQHLIPLTPRGAGTGLSGGALPVCNGIVLSMEKFNRIIFIDERNLQVTCEPGVINQHLQEAVKEKNLFYPPDPASKGSCFIGGNLAENAGGPKAVKYGVTKDYVLNLEVVLPTGELIWTGANVLKNSTGYNLTQLMVGSEGTLGIITKVVFKLLPYPKYNLLMLVPFNSIHNACSAVSEVFRRGVIPSAMELMERDAIEFTAQHVQTSIKLKDTTAAHLIVEVDGNDLELLYKECDVINEVMMSFECDEILFADAQSQKDEIWKLRRAAGEAVKTHSIYKEEDTVVPRAELPELLHGVKEIGKKHGFRSVCYGHAGDGNLHVNILKDNMTDDEWNKKLPFGIKEIFELCVKLGGTISGEHGIGWVQKDYMPIALNESNLKIQKGIKQLFDPNHILNPNKIFN